MATTGKRYIDRTQERNLEKMLDGRTKAVLNAVLTEPPGAALAAYLRAHTAAGQRKR